MLLTISSSRGSMPAVIGFARPGWSGLLSGPFARCVETKSRRFAAAWPNALTPRRHVFWNGSERTHRNHNWPGREDRRMKGCRPLTDTDVELMQASFGGRYATRDRALFLLGVKSGFRISELLSLRMGEIGR